MRTSTPEHRADPRQRGVSCDSDLFAVVLIWSIPVITFLGALLRLD
ncbi:hypothetical protein [Nocardioides sp. W7]|nr:hypothetical protein [Nocardioides sp. W7]